MQAVASRFSTGAMISAHENAPMPSISCCFHGGTDDVTGLEVLQVVTTDRSGTAHHRTDHDRGHRAQRRPAGRPA